MEESHALSQATGQLWTLSKPCLDLNGPRSLGIASSGLAVHNWTSWKEAFEPPLTPLLLGESNYSCRPMAFVAKLLGRESHILLTSYLQTDSLLSSRGYLPSGPPDPISQAR